MLVSLVALLGAAAIIASSLGWEAHQYSTRKAAATTVVKGRVVADSLGEEDDIRVSWRDGRDQVHAQRFSVYDVDTYMSGTSFPVRYDATLTSPVGFPADAENDVRLDDLTVPIGLALAGALLLLCAWPFRWWCYRRALEGAAQPMTAQWLLGTLGTGAISWVCLEGSGAGEPITRWQRVMWHPMLDTTHGLVPVSVHGDLARRRRVVVELEGGATLIPIGRLSRKPPPEWTTTGREPARDNVEAAFVWPPELVAEPIWKSWLLGAALFGARGTVVGVGLAILLAGGGVAVIPFAAVGVGISVHAWAFFGAEPVS